MNQPLSVSRPASAIHRRVALPRTRGDLPLPARSAKGVVLRVVRAAMSADWRPYDAAAALLSYVDGDARLLEVARARVATCVADAPTVVQARALATLNVALSWARRDSANAGDAEPGLGEGADPDEVAPVGDGRDRSTR